MCEPYVIHWLLVAWEQRRKMALVIRVTEPTLEFATTNDNRAMVGIAAKDTAHRLYKPSADYFGSDALDTKALIDKCIKQRRGAGYTIEYQYPAGIAWKINAVKPSR